MNGKKTEPVGRKERTKERPCPRTPIVNVTNILQTCFALISFHQQFTNTNCKHIKDGKNTYEQKICLENVGKIDFKSDES